ncbi:MAG: TSUP family transporter, partial [Gammaproteobacteria bacterium]|nr:TSUP family transporter [Gammaproteobacteria bacterium]NIR21087.1 TSUP family transporter [Gammaproteobacteria bacterium]NIT93215.1 TSUP family transporter [Gammaproteobacteria bacterium]
VLGGMTTFFGPPLIMFLFALDLEKDVFVGTISTLYLCAAVPLAFALGMFGVMGAQEYLWSTIAAAPLFLGVLIGQWLRARISQSLFRRGLLVMLLVVGVRLVYRAIA